MVSFLSGNFCPTEVDFFLYIITTYWHLWPTVNYYKQEINSINCNSYNKRCFFYFNFSSLGILSLYHMHTDSNYQIISNCHIVINLKPFISMPILLYCSELLSSSDLQHMLILFFHFFNGSIEPLKQLWMILPVFLFKGLDWTTRTSGFNCRYKETSVKITLTVVIL